MQEMQVPVRNIYLTLSPMLRGHNLKQRQPASGSIGNYDSIIDEHHDHNQVITDN
jgi:hypothetical protein